MHESAAPSPDASPGDRARRVQKGIPEARAGRDRLFEPFSLTAFLPMNHPVPCRCQSLISPPTRGTNPLRRSKQWADH